MIEVLKLFKCMVTDHFCDGEYNLDGVNRGFITDFFPTPAQSKLLISEFKPLALTTLFTVAERKNATAEQLINKQIFHYIEVYGLNSPGLFNLEQKDGKIFTMTYIRGVSVSQLEEMVRNLLYANAPIKDTASLKKIIDFYGITYDVDLIRNNEMRVLLFKLGKHKFSSGDDAVRYMCFASTDSALLIKSKQVISAIKLKNEIFTERFFMDHFTPLARVFHRHKNLILAAKNKGNRRAVNKIARLAKKVHEPLGEALNKKFIAEAYSGRLKHVGRVLSTMSIRDKFKFLNLIEYKMRGNRMDAFVIRNGKVHLEGNRPILDTRKLMVISDQVLHSLEKDLSHLKKRGTNILLDPFVDYGLPISRKQVLGQLPFGTAVSVDGKEIATGIYWENAWGANDLDLAAIDMDGHRVGWGQYSGYNDMDIIFSGDITSAPEGAMEFMTSKVSYSDPYGLFVNVFSGSEGVQCEIVVGSKTSEKKLNIKKRDRYGYNDSYDAQPCHWIESPVLREKINLETRGNIFGFVRDGKFIVYSCNLNDRRGSFGEKERAIIAKSLTDFWTIQRLFDVLNIRYHTEHNPLVKYDYDLRYVGFSLDKLENMLDPERENVKIAA